MPGQRRKGIERISVTLDEELLAEVEARAVAEGRDRLALFREALAEYLAKQKPAAAKAVAKPAAKAAAKPKAGPRRR